MTSSFTVEEHEQTLGEDLQRLRIRQNLTQNILAERSGISVSAVKNLESGRGATLHTLISVLRTLGREGWLQSIAPVPTIHPFGVTRGAAQRQRVRPRKEPTDADSR